MAVSPVQDMFPAPVGYCGTPLPQGTGDRLQRESVSRRCAPAMDSSGGYPLVGSRYIQGKCKLVQKGKCIRAFSDTKTPSCRADDFPCHIWHLLQKMRPRATTMRDPTPTRPTERPTGRSLARLHRTARSHTATPNTSSVYPRKRVPRTKCLNSALRGYTRAHPRTQCLSDGAETGSRPIRRRGRADPVGAGRGAVILA